MKIAQNFHEKSMNEGDWVIDIWTYAAQFDITFQNEDPSVTLPLITIKQR